MAWVLMLKGHDRVWGPAGPKDRRVTTRYREGCRYSVTRAVRDELVGLGVAKPVKAPPSAHTAPAADPLRIPVEHDQPMLPGDGEA